MRNIFSFLIVAILSISVSCHNQYYISNAEYSEEGKVFSGNLIFKGFFDPDNYHIDWNNKTSHLLKPIENLIIKISLECDKYLHIYVTDALEKRWEHPFSISDSYKEKIKTCSQTKSLKDFGLAINDQPNVPFYFSLTNPETNELIY